jgi:diketogulonate reductase-like aldo/keto reductase
MVTAALDAGFRLVDTAADHHGYDDASVARAVNRYVLEKERGAAVDGDGREGRGAAVDGDERDGRDVTSDTNSDVPDQLGSPTGGVFVTTKIQPGDFGRERTLTAVARARARMQGLARPRPLDLVLLHAPYCDDDAGVQISGGGEGDESGVSSEGGASDVSSEGGDGPAAYGGCIDGTAGTWQDSLLALVELQRVGDIRAIGVSNFEVDELEAALKLAADGKVDVVQNQCDPFHQDLVRRAFFDRHLHSRMPLSFTPLLRLKRCHACDQWPSSRESTASYRFTL